MTELKTLKNLAELTDACFQAEQAKIRSVVETETKLRRALSKLESNRKAALMHPPDELRPIQQIGADLLWQGWIGRNREELNRQLALCLVQKAKLITNLRRAYGKQMAAKTVLAEEQCTIAQTRQRAAIIQDQTFALWRATDI